MPAANMTNGLDVRRAESKEPVECETSTTDPKRVTSQFTPLTLRNVSQGGCENAVFVDPDEKVEGHMAFAGR